MSSLISIDINVLEFINVTMANPVLTRIMLFVTDKHNWFPVIGLAVVILLISGRNRPHPGGVFSRINPRVVVLGLILSVLVADQLGGLLKDNVNRIRPNRDPAFTEVLNLPLHTAGRRSFPSNHAANTAAVAVFISAVYPPLAVPAAIFAFTIGFSRTYLGVHYPSDVLAGWLLGALVGYGVWLLLRKRLHGTGITGFANMFRYRQYQDTCPPAGDWVPRNWQTLDGHQVTGYLLPGSSSLVVFIHGMGGSALSRVRLAEQIRDLNGASFLLVPLRGSDGHRLKLTSGGVDEVHDVLGALTFAESQGFSPSTTVVYGTSMGGSASIKAVSVAGRLTPAGLIVHGGFSSFFKSALNRTGQFGALLLKLLMPADSVRNLTRFKPVYWLKYFHRGCSLEYIYGVHDRVAPPKDGKVLATASSGIPCRFEVLEGRGHPTGKNTSDEEFVSILNRALVRILSK